MIRIIALICIFLISPLIAQAQNLDLSFEKQGDDNLNWEMTIIFTVTSATQNGMLVEIPGQIRVVPMNVRINQKDIWMQNSEQVPQIDSLTTWHSVDEGLVFLFGEGLLSSADQLQMTCMATVLDKQISNEAVIQIRAVVNTNPIQISEQIIASGNIAITLSE
jgi:hypothetical protein